MRSRIFVSAGLLVGVLASSALAFSSHRHAAVQWAVVYFNEPTLVMSTLVQGPVLVTHDDRKMARGEACTTVRLFEPAKGAMEEIASFHCIPVERAAVGRFTIRTRPDSELGFGCVLTEYQFAGDTEAHGVPMTAMAH